MNELNDYLNQLILEKKEALHLYKIAIRVNRLLYLFYLGIIALESYYLWIGKENWFVAMCIGVMTACLYFVIIQNKEVHIEYKHNLDLISNFEKHRTEKRERDIKQIIKHYQLLATNDFADENKKQELMLQAAEKLLHKCL